MTITRRNNFKIMCFVIVSLGLCSVVEAAKSANPKNIEKNEENMQNKLVETDEMTLYDDLKESRKSNNKGNQNQPSFVEKMLPMMVIPFLVSTAMIPLMLMAIKFILVKSALIGKISIILMLINFLRRRATGGGVFSHNINHRREDEVAYEHYGYEGHDEYGNYINRKRRKRKVKFNL